MSMQAFYTLLVLDHSQIEPYFENVYDLTGATLDQVAEMPGLLSWEMW